jgi:hypothetical protein
VYPNPSWGELNIQLPQDGADWQIEIWSLEGKFIALSSHWSERYDWSHLAAGTYLLQFLRNGRKVYSEKLVLGK